MTTKYGRSPWIEQFPKARVPSYPRQRGVSNADVVIVGGGLSGCATAYAFAAAEVNAVLVEAKQLGRGSTAFESGWISDEPGVAFADLEKAIGLAGARRGFRAWRRAALDFAALLRRLDVKCALEQRTAITVARTPEQAVQMKREQKARRGAGLDAPLLAGRTVAADVGLEAVAGLRARDGATLDPYRACLGLAAAAKARGALIFEESPARKITFGRKAAEVITAGGRIRAARVVVATGVPTAMFKSLARHFWFKSAYLALTAPVPPNVRQQLGRRAAVVRDMADPPHLVRWVGDERLLVAGADTITAPARLRDKIIVQRTGQLMYELSTLYPDISGLLPERGWAADYARTAEGLPYIGPHRNYPWHLFAFGDSSHSVTGAYLASRVLLRHYFDEMDPADEVFAFTR
jgi:glycine/D-amino acid oxidase-like deaminating enzyme